MARFKQVLLKLFSQKICKHEIGTFLLPDTGCNIQLATPPDQSVQLMSLGEVVSNN